MSDGMQVPERTEEQARQDEDELFWHEVAAYTDAAWRGFIPRDYDNQGYYDRGGERAGFTFKGERHYLTIMGDDTGLTKEELFGPDDGPYNPDERSRYLA